MTFITMLITTLLVALFAVIIAVFALQAPTQWQVGEVVRTPDSAFENLQDYPFAANFVDCLGYRVHYIDEGPKDGQVVLLMHGQPSWSYLYRHMIPPLVDAGFRVIAPDNVGFGKSDKPVDQADHSYQMHVDVMSEFVDQLQLEGATLFAQDWGGLIGLRVVAERSSRFSRIMISNTTLPAMGGIKGWLGFPLFRFAVWREGKVQELGVKKEANNGSEKAEFRFTQWVAYARHTQHFDVQALFQKATKRELSAAALDGYAAPYPSEKYMAAVRRFPSMVASQLRQNQRVMDEFYAKWDKPFITAFGTDDVIMKGRDKPWQKKVPGAKGQAHTLIDDASHFIQEDKPVEISEQLIQFIRNN